jgi:mono/diheme cytochrome c family protein
MAKGDLDIHPVDSLQRQPQSELLVVMLRQIPQILCIALLGASPAAAAQAAGKSPAQLFGAVLDSATCVDCHSSEGVASDTRLVFPAYDATAAEVRSFSENVMDLIDPDSLQQSRLYRKPTARMAHAGGERIAPGTADETALLTWISSLAKGKDPSAAAELLGHMQRPAAEKGGRVLRRLTAKQYENTITDLFGDALPLAAMLPPEDFVDGFKNQHLGQAAAPALIEGYSLAAQFVADNVVRGIEGGDPRKLLPCHLAALDGECRDKFIAGVGLRTFRRPLAQAELQRLRTMFVANPSPLEGVRTVLEFLLQSPSFLYLANSHDPKVLPFVRAARLSYFLTNTTTSDALLAKATAGGLQTAEDLKSAARSLLESPKAAKALDEFLAQWLRFDTLLNSFKDRRSFPQFNSEVASAMAEETRRMVRHLVFSDQNFMDLFTAKYTFVTPELAKIYELPAPSEAFGRVEYPEKGDRSGVLGHGSFLTATSKPSETSPTARGLFVREHFLCQSTPPPPPSVNMDLPQMVGDRPLTNKERLAAHLSSPSCAACHRLIDTIGFGFEKYNAIGGHQQVMKVSITAAPTFTEQGIRVKPPAPKVFELPLDTKGYVLGIKNSEFSNPAELGRILAGNGQCQMCIVKQVFRYAMGRRESSADHVALDQIFEVFSKSGFHFRDLLVATVAATEFTVQETVVHE